MAHLSDKVTVRDHATASQLHLLGKKNKDGFLVRKKISADFRGVVHVV